MIQAVAQAEEREHAPGPGPVVRPYALVRGRTRPTGERLDVITMVHAIDPAVPDRGDLEPEHLSVLAQCSVPMSVADIASALDLPLAVIRILLADLRDRGLIRSRRPGAGHRGDIRLLQEVADGLRRL